VCERECLVGDLGSFMLLTFDLGEKERERKEDKRKPQLG